MGLGTSVAPSGRVIAFAPVTTNSGPTPDSMAAAMARWATERPAIVASSLCPAPVKRVPAPAASRIGTVTSLILSTGRLNNR